MHEQKLCNHCSIIDIFRCIQTIITDSPITACPGSKNVPPDLLLIKCPNSSKLIDSLKSALE